MPGTGHSARYKGSISNRSKVSPFEQLAKWNQQLLGADGAVPSIVNGGDLQFKKLDASDIAGVMHNPATEDLNMNNFNIINATNITLSNELTITGGNGLGITNTAATGRISKFGGEIILQSSNNSGGVVETATITLKATPGGPNNRAILLESDAVDTDIFIGHSAVAAAAVDVRSVTIGTSTTPYAGGEIISIGTRAISGITNQVTIGNIGTNCSVNLRGGTAIGAGIRIGATTNQKIGFYNTTPITKPTAVPVTAAGIHAALVSLGLIA